MFVAALFTIARTWKQPKCPSTEEWIKKMLYIYTMEYYSVYFVLYEYCYLGFLVISVCMKYLFPSPHFQSVFVVLKWVSCKQHMNGSCYFIQTATLYLLIGAFSPLTFKVIMDSYVLIAIFNLFTVCFHSSSLFFHLPLGPALVVWWFSLVECLCFFLLFLCIYCQLFICGYHGIHIYWSITISTCFIQVVL